MNVPRHRCRVKHCGRIDLAAFTVAGAILQLSNFNREQATGSSLRCLSIVNLLSVCERRDHCVADGTHYALLRAKLRRVPFGWQASKDDLYRWRVCSIVLLDDEQSQLDGQLLLAAVAIDVLVEALFP